MEPKRWPHVRASRRGGFRPRLEALERRCCPCSNSLLDDGTLLVIGDDASETIAIRDDGPGRGVTVRCDDGAAQTITGVRRILLRSAGGDDRVNHLIGNPNETPANLLFDLGQGNDALTLDWTNPNEEAPPRAEGRQVVFDVLMGRGDDLLYASFVNPPDGDFVFRADLGGGGDAFQATFIPVEQVHPAGRFPANFNVLGGDGADEVGFIIEGGHVGAGAVVNLNMDGGNGADRLAASLRHLTIEGAVSVTSTGGDGADRITARVERPVFIGPAVVDMAVHGGGGADFITVLGADPAGHQYESGRARLNLSASGGGGGDLVYLRAGVLDEPPDRGLRLDWSVVITGDEGADLIDARFRFDPSGQDHVAVALLGGVANDDLTLAMVGLSDPDDLEALLEGGDGYDIARATHNVLADALIRNVEAVFLID